MPARTGGDLPDPINTETEYAGKVPTTNSVTSLGPNTRKLKGHEKLRLGYLTGQEEDPDAPRESGFMFGVDSRYPAHPDMNIPLPPVDGPDEYLEP